MYCRACSLIGSNYNHYNECVLYKEAGNEAKASAHVSALRLRHLRLNCRIGADESKGVGKRRVKKVKYRFDFVKNF